MPPKLADLQNVPAPRRCPKQMQGAISSGAGCQSARGRRTGALLRVTCWWAVPRGIWTSCVTRRQHMASPRRLEEPSGSHGGLADGDSIFGEMKAIGSSRDQVATKRTVAR